MPNQSSLHLQHRVVWYSPEAKAAYKNNDKYRQTLRFLFTKSGIEEQSRPA